jgi:thermitase
MIDGARLLNIRPGGILQGIGAITAGTEGQPARGERGQMSAQKKILVTLVAAALAVSPGALAGAGSGPRYRPSELLVRFKHGQDGPAASAIAKIGAKVLDKISRIDVKRLGLPKNLPVDAAIEQLRRLPLFDFVEPNYIFRAAWKTNDPLWGDQWGIAKIRTAAGWGLETGRAAVTIAIVDTGVDLDHPDLVRKIVAGYDFIDGDDQPDDVGGHGTHCAGIAAASTNNGEGIAGICANCTIMPVRVLGPDGGSASDVANGIVWAVDHGAKVISLSLGGLFESIAQNEAIDYAWSKGAVIVAAAGNYGVSDAHYPAFYPKCISVGATESDDRRADYSNYGDWVDVAAPGSFIMSTVPDGYEMMSGTSMATPAVAGLAGLVWSAMGAGASNAAVREVIEKSCDPIGDWVSKGRINVRRAIELAEAAAPKAPASGGQGGGSPGGGSSGGSVTPGAGGVAPGYQKIAQGSALGGKLESLAKSDDDLLVARSTQTGKKRYVDVQASFRIGDGATPKALEVALEARFYAADSSVTVFLYDFAGAKWDWIGRADLGVVDTKASVRRDNPKPYVGPGGEVRVRLYSESDWWATFDLGVDELRVLPK